MKLITLTNKKQIDEFFGEETVSTINESVKVVFKNKSDETEKLLSSCGVTIILNNDNSISIKEIDDTKSYLEKDKSKLNSASKKSKKK